MANTLICLVSHVVFSTKHRQNLINPALEPRLYGYMDGIVRDLDSRCLAINGTENHVHMLLSLSKRIALSSILQQVKASSTKWAKSFDRGIYNGFQWQDGYGAFSVSRSNIVPVAEYIHRQKEHHRRMSFEDEFRELVTKAGIEFDERYLFD